MTSSPRSSSPRLSVVMNVWNGERFLELAIDSVLNQTYRDFEFLIIDDASTDGSSAILGRLTDPRVRVVRLPERVPLGAARNHGVEAARGEWIAWIDQDDLWMPDKLSRQMELIDQHGGPDLGLVFGRTLYLRGNKSGPDVASQCEYEDLPTGSIHRPLLELGCFISMSSLLVRKAAWMQVGNIPDRYQVAVDYWLAAAVSKSWQALAVQDACAWYRQHEANMTWSFGFRAYEEAHAIVEEFADALPAALARRRQRVWQTLMSVEQFRTPGQRGAAVARLLSRGSLTYLLSRPLAWLSRRLRRQCAGGSPALRRYEAERREPRPSNEAVSRLA